MKAKNLATEMLPERLTVFEFLTELNNDQLNEMIDMVIEVKAMRAESEATEGK